MKTLKELATEILAVTETKTRASGESFMTINYDALEYGQELQNAVRTAHNGRLPDDYTYGVCIDFIQAITEYSDFNQDDVHEWADGYVDIYTHDLLKWSVDNSDWIEQAVEEFGMPEAKGFSMDRLCALGQYAQYSHIGNVLLSALQDIQADRVDNSAEA